MRFFLFLGFLMLFSACNREPTSFPVVKYVGAIRNITQLNDTSAQIYLDTIKPHRRLYGLGPMAGMTGEILIVDGRPYVSKITSAGRHRIRQTYNAHATQFVYAHVRSWQEADLPRDTVLDNNSLGRHLEALALKSGIDVEKPFPFLLKGRFASISYHVSDRHKMDDRYVPPARNSAEQADVIILGFFSKHHQDIFTEPGSNVVMSFMTTSASVIGQIDQLTLRGKRVQLLLPK